MDNNSDEERNNSKAYKRATDALRPKLEAALERFRRNPFVFPAGAVDEDVVIFIMKHAREAGADEEILSSVQEYLDEGEWTLAYTEVVRAWAVGIDDDLARGQKQRRAASAGGQARSSQYEAERRAIAEYVSQGKTLEQAARKFGKSKDAVAKTIQRHGKK